MRRLLSYLLGNTKKTKALDWLSIASQKIDFKKSEIIVDQSEKLILSTPSGQVCLSYTDKEKIKYFSDLFIIVPAKDNYKQESNLLKNYIVNFHDQLIQLSTSLLRKELGDEVMKQENTDEQQLRAIEWLKVSLNVLEQAIDHCLSNSDLLYKGHIYAYQEPKLRIHLTSMSLSFVFIFHENGTLQITTWNNKDKTPDYQRKPDMNMVFNTVKNQAFDLFIPVLVKISKISTQGF